MVSSSLFCTDEWEDCFVTMFSHHVGRVLGDVSIINYYYRSGAAPKPIAQLLFCTRGGLGLFLRTIGYKAGDPTA